METETNVELSDEEIVCASVLLKAVLDVRNALTKTLKRHGLERDNVLLERGFIYSHWIPERTIAWTGFSRDESPTDEWTAGLWEDIIADDNDIYLTAFLADDSTED